MTDINYESIFSPGIPPLRISKILIEQNKGFFKEINNPHIDNEQESEERIEEENNDIVFTIEGITLDSNVNRSQSAEKRILETHNVIVPLIIMNENDENEMSLLKGFVSTFKRNIEAGNFETLSFVSENVIEIEPKLNSIKRTYSTSFKMRMEPRNLYFIYGSYRIIETQGPLGKILTKEYSPISVDTIFEKSNLKTETDIYVLKENGELWVGPTIKTDKNLYFTYETNARQLLKKKTNNIKIQDHRILSKINKKILNFSKINNRLLESKIKQVQKINRQFYFSDLNINQKNKVPSCFFFFKYKEFLLDNCLFSRMYEKIPNALSQEIFKKSTILDFQIYRQRIQRSANHNVPFENSKKELIVQTRQSAASRTLAEVSNCKEVQTLDRNLNENNRFYKFYDLELENNNFGLYEYSVEIEIDDPSIEIIKNDIKTIGFIVKKMNQLLTNKQILNKNDSISNIVPMQDSLLDKHLNTYFTILNRYFINENLSGENDVYKLKQSLKNQIVSIVDDPIGVLNFIKLLNNLEDQLMQIISLEIFSFDDPHINFYKNNINKNSKRPIKIENKFSNNVVDTTINNIKNISFIPTQSRVYYDELNFEQFIDFLRQLSFNQRIVEDSILPLSLTQEGYGYVFNSVSNKYSEKQLSKIVIENMLKNNINVSIEQYQNNDLNADKDNEENYYYREDFNNFYNYFSSLYLKNREIDEVSRNFLEQQNSLLLQFSAKLEILTGTGLQKGVWAKVESIGSTSIEYGGFLAFRIKFDRADERNRNWQSLNDVYCNDSYFFVSVSSSGEMNRIIEFINTLLNKNINLVQELQNRLSSATTSNILTTRTENFKF